MGRPSVYTPELATEICDKLATGDALNVICKSEHIPSEATVRGWVVDDREGFAAIYARARDMGLQSRGDRVRDEIMAEADPSRAKLLFDHERWYLGKMAPRTFGDRLDVAVSGDVSFGERLAAGRAAVKPAADADD